ncbi:MAG: hypothetical protein AB1424_15190 [Thermodesulfobacteriota bacterium]
MGIWETLFVSITGLVGAGGTLYITKYFEDKKEKRQLEQLKLQIINENLKNSCIRINEEINKVLKTISFNQPYDDAWNPTELSIFEATKDALTKEFLFVEKSVARALNLFLTIMSETVFWEFERHEMRMSFADKDRIIKRAYEELEYIAEHITDFLRSQINLVNEEPPILSKTTLLQLCRFINKPDFEGLKFPNQAILKLDGVQSPMDLVRFADNNLALFKKELVYFLNFLKNPLNFKNTKYFISEIAESEKLLSNL